MNAQLIARLAIPATVVALTVIFAIDLQLTRKARLEALRIMYTNKTAEEKPE